MIRYFFETLFQKLKLSVLITIIVIITTFPFDMGSLSILEYLLTCFLVVFIYSIIEGIYFYIKNKSYKSNIDYLRELPRDYSPSMVSFLMNMKIEYKKDLLADLIYLEQLGIIKILDDETINIISDKNWNAYESHLKYLVEEMKKINNLNINAIINNKNIYSSYRYCIIEDLKVCNLLDNYSVNILNIVILFAIFIFFRFFAVFGMDLMINNIKNAFSGNEMSNEEAIGIVLKFANMAQGLQKMYSLFPVIIVTVFGLIKVIPFVKRITGTDYMRSKQGKKDVSMWLSYYKFIKDFSIMNERNLEEKNLWGYYFAYRLAPGINTKVIKKFDLGYERYIIK